MSDSFTEYGSASTPAPMTAVMQCAAPDHAVPAENKASVQGCEIMLGVRCTRSVEPCRAEVADLLTRTRCPPCFKVTSTQQSLDEILDQRPAASVSEKSRRQHAIAGFPETAEFLWPQRAGDAGDLVKGSKAACSRG